MGNEWASINQSHYYFFSVELTAARAPSSLASAFLVLALFFFSRRCCLTSYSVVLRREDMSSAPGKGAATFYIFAIGFYKGDFNHDRKMADMKVSLE